MFSGILWARFAAQKLVSTLANSWKLAGERPILALPGHDVDNAYDDCDNHIADIHDEEVPSPPYWPVQDEDWDDDLLDEPFEFQDSEDDLQDEPPSIPAPIPVRRIPTFSFGSPSGEFSGVMLIRVEPDFDVSDIDEYHPIDAFDVPIDEYEYGIPRGHDLELQSYFTLDGDEPLFYYDAVRAYNAMLNFGRGDLFPQDEDELEYEEHAGELVDGSGDHHVSAHVWDSDWEDE